MLPQDGQKIRRKNERGSRRGGWTFLHQHRALVGCAIKDATEIEGFFACHITGDAFLVRYLRR